MRNSDLFTLLLATAALATAACRGLDDEQPRDPGAAEHALEPISPIHSTRTSGAPDLDWMDVTHPAVAPSSRSCCVNCVGDLTHSRWNLGDSDECNARARAFCEKTYDRLISAEWDFC